MPTPPNWLGGVGLLARRVEALGTPTDHSKIGLKLLIHVESLIRFVHGFATSGLNSRTMADQTKGS